MRIPVKVDEVRCNRHKGPMEEDRATDSKAAVLFSVAANLEGGEPLDAADVDLCSHCEKRVLNLHGQILTPRKRVKAAPK